MLGRSFRKCMECKSSGDMLDTLGVVVIWIFIDLIVLWILTG